MGTHWTHGQSHEFHGLPFTSTMVYGDYEGKMVFNEPMLTKSYLESKPNRTSTIRVPARYPKEGRYPTSFSVTLEPAAKQYRVRISAFQNRN